MNSRDAYVILNSIPDIGPLRVKQLLECFGTPEAVLAASHQSLTRVHGIGDRLAAAVASWRTQVDLAAEYDRVERAGATVITVADDDYPPLLRQIYDPPLCLYVRGRVDALHRANAGIAMVGSRRTDRYGVEAADHLASAAAVTGWTVVSGLARGVDTVVHEAVLRAKGTTVAVIGSGLGKIYPQENVDLARRIAETGAVVSEFPMLFPPAKRSFPMRNRIISGLCRGTLVVQAGSRSGSLITAAQALEQNRLVFAVPGPITSPLSRGCHALIRDGARLVESFQDVLEEFSFLPGMSGVPPDLGTSTSAPSSGAQSAPDDLTLTETERKLLAALGQDERGIDDLIADTGEGTAETLRAVFTLEMRHLVRQLPGRRVVAVRGAWVTG